MNEKVAPSASIVGSTHLAGNAEEGAGGVFQTCEERTKKYEEKGGRVWYLGRQGGNWRASLGVGGQYRAATKRRMGRLSPRPSVGRKEIRKERKVNRLERTKEFKG